MSEIFDFSAIPGSADSAASLIPGEVILEAGTISTFLYVVTSGEALIKIGDTVLEAVGKGGIIGEMALVDAISHSTHIVAGDHCRVTPIGKERCFSLFRENPTFAEKLMKLIARRLCAINFLAHQNPLTQLPNREHLEEHLCMVLKRAKRNGNKASVIVIDLDGFRVIKDMFGHAAGDQLVSAAAARLRKLLREADFVAHVEPYRFAIPIENDSDVQNVVTLAQKLMEEMARPYPLQDHDAELAPSVGISCYPQDGNDERALLQAATIAASRAKNQGGLTYQFFSPALNADALEELAITHKLRLALERDEFVLHYQPRIDLFSGKVIGVEALIRWNDPERGMISPATFIPLAEKKGMISDIGEWVLNTACRQAREWQDAGDPVLLVAVNISMEQLRKVELPDRISEILRGADLSAEYLELEVTESVAMRDAEHTVTALKALSEMSLALAIDDFGTGYSSLNYLKRFPVRYLKIDQSFVRGLPHDPSDVIIVKTIISMAKNLGMRLIAEGVETPEQLAFLKNEGCQEAQGYLFSKPLTAAELSWFVRDHNHRLRH